MNTITRLVLREFPHVCLDSHLFVLALALVIAAAIFAIAARALSIAMWYPLCILLIPAIIAYWTTRRRGLYFIKVTQVYFIVITFSLPLGISVHNFHHTPNTVIFIDIYLCMITCFKKETIYLNFSVMYEKDIILR